MTDEEKAEKIIKEKYCNNCEERQTFPDIYNCSDKEHCDDYYLLKEGLLLQLYDEGGKGMTEAEKFCEENNGLNGLMNKISMGLKDAALQQGFEVICKRLAKLEKELMHLKGCKTCTDRPKGELATVCATEYEGHCIAQKMTYIKELQEEIEQLKTVCDFNCLDHKLATHNACLTCPAVRNSPHHDLKDVSDEELQKIIKDAEAEMEI